MFNSANILPLREGNSSLHALLGGKGANLGELFRINDIRVPEGFVVTANAYNTIVASHKALNNLLDELSNIQAGDSTAISHCCSAIRELMASVVIPEAIVAEIASHLSRYDDATAFAIRSSATAEDMPGASFAGQLDSWLNITGPEQILLHITRCWASLFTDRAVTYRIQQGIDHRSVSMAVIVQQMIVPYASGVLFTADPVTGNRKESTIEAGFGLGEALVAGRVHADRYKVRGQTIIGKNIAANKPSAQASPGGGIAEPVPEGKQATQQTLTDEQVLQLVRIGKTIEQHFNHPQDIEWCFTGHTFFIVQSRPITTLYPVPVINQEPENRVFVSVGHQQMMTDAMKPLGLSVFQLTVARPMYEAGGRLFVDVTHELSTESGRQVLINMLGHSDPLMKDAFQTIIERNFVPLLQQDKPTAGAGNQGLSPADLQTQLENDPAIVQALIRNTEKSLAALRQNIRTKSGPALFDFILADMQQWQQDLKDPRSMGAIMTAMNAYRWINQKMEEWLGEKNVAGILTQSAPNNVTAAMGLALMEVADAIRPYPAVIAYLQQVQDDPFLEGLKTLEGGPEVLRVIQAFLDKYGMRCPGEIDITRTRWSEHPAQLVPILLTNLQHFEPGAAGRKFQQGVQEALQKEQELVARLQQMPCSEARIRETRHMIGLIRNFAGYREYPKYAIVNRFFIYKQALLREAERLVQAGIIRQKEDVYFLRYEEFRELVTTNVVNNATILQRKKAYQSYKKLTPPRVITSDGEMITGNYNRMHLPAGALAGLAVSAGIVEGRARVLFDMDNALLEEGDILVTTFTDPGWTPLFLSVKGLVTEVGGLMTHGAVIAREYGLPAVAGVQQVTRLIRDGQRIRVNGTDGYVELL